MIRGLLIFVGILFFVANVMVGMLVIAAYMRYSNQDQYHNEVFRVTGSGIISHRGGGNARFLEGEVRGKKEIFTDPHETSMSWDAYLKLVPVGTEIPIKFNPDMTDILLQKQNLRVINRDWNFLNDRWLVHFYLAYIAAPAVIIVAALYITRPRKRIL